MSTEQGSTFIWWFKKNDAPQPLGMQTWEVHLQKGQGTTEEERHKIQTSSLENQCYQNPLLAWDRLTELTLGKQT